MAKILERILSEDDPIYLEGWKISSHHKIEARGIVLDEMEKLPAQEFGGSEKNDVTK